MDDNAGRGNPRRAGPTEKVGRKKQRIAIKAHPQIKIRRFPQFDRIEKDAGQAKKHSHLWPLVRVGWGMDKRTREQLGSDTIDPDANLCAQSVGPWAILQDRAKIQERSPGRAGGSLLEPTCASWLYEAQSATLLSRGLLYYYFVNTRGGVGETN